VVLPLLSILGGESCLLVSWCAGDRCDMAGSDDDHDRSRRHGAEDWGWPSTMHKETMSACFSVWASKPTATVW
jgi:hypothetical protein